MSTHYVSREGSESVRIWDVELPRYLSSSHAGIPERVYDHKVSELRIVLVLVEEKELVGQDVPACRVSTLPSSLIDDEDKLQVILHYGMIDGAWVYAFGMHTVWADRAEMRQEFFLDRDDALLVFDALVYQLNVGIF